MAEADVPPHIEAVLSECQVRERGFLVTACDLNGLELSHPALPGEHRFQWRGIEEQREQAEWLKAVLQGWPELDLAADAPTAPAELRIARLLRASAMDLRTFPPERTDDAIERIAWSLVSEGLLSEDSANWLVRSLEIDADAD